MKRINIEEICRNFNTIRQENLRKKFTPAEIKELCHQIGINSTAFRKMAQSAFFRTRKNGQNTEYAFTDTPIYKAQFEKVYNDVREAVNKRRRKVSKPSELTEESAVKFLKSLGYILKRPIGIDEEALKKECPEIYDKFLTYVNT